MRNRPKLFSSHLTRRQRRVYGAVLGFYVFAFLAMVWPFYGLFNRARPLVLGMPLSLFYLAVLVTASFLVQLALFRWEGRRGADSEDDEHNGGEDA